MKTTTNKPKKILTITADLIVIAAFFLQSAMPILAIAPADATGATTTTDTTVTTTQITDSTTPPETTPSADNSTAPIDTPPATDTTAPATTTDTTTPAQTAAPVVDNTTPAAVTDTTSVTAPNDPSATNTTTGAASDNTTQTNVNSQTNITNTNTAKTNNNSYLQADTGHNNANYNTGSGIITTEKAKGQSGVLNVINLNSTNVQSQVPSPDNAGNSNTGADSNNTSITNINNQTVVKNINDSNTVNVINADVNSGQNSSEHNTGHGIILNGDADLGLNLVTIANANITGSNKFYADWQNVFDNYTGDLNIQNDASAVGSTPLTNLIVNAKNQNTGAGSTNTAIVNVNDQTTVTNQNTGNIDNQINANVISGQSKANYNTGTGSVTSGKVNASVNAVNFLNTNVTSSNLWMKTFNVYGDFKGNILLPQMPAPNLVLSDTSATTSANTTTGAGSTNDASTTVNNSTTISNQNQAVISNDVNMKTNTGGNQTSFNNGSGAIKFGQADAQTNEVNVANMNVTGDSWWIVIVNKFGNWSGAATGTPSDVVVNATSSATIFSPQNSGVTVTNDSTGPQSNNSAGADINHTVDISNANQAYINNAVNLNAISGENEAQYNSGHGYIDTGDIKSSVNLVNFANANINVGNWLVAVVNVFGDWQGNLLFNTTSGPSNSITPSITDFSQYSTEITPNQVSIATGSTQTFSAIFKDPSGTPVNPQPEFTWSATGGTVAPYVAPVSNNSAGTTATTSANTTTGAGSTNDATTNSNSTTNVANTNNADTTTNTSASSTTGSNTANYNTGSGVVATGQANTGSNTTNNINNNQTNVGSGTCGAGTNGSANSGTGADSLNTSTTNNNCSTDVTNNNNATTDTNIAGSANTGGNSANYNTGTGAIDTSWANAYVGAYNQQNSNQITVGDVTQDFQPTDKNSVVFTAGDTAGTYTITATANSKSATATIIVTGGDTTTGDTTSTGGENGGGGGGNGGAGNGEGENNNPAPVVSGGGNGGGGGGGGGGGVTLASAKKYRGDLNNDGKVDYYDLSILMGNWGKKMKNKTADINNDGKVNDIDFSILVSDWAKYLAELKNTTKKV